MTVPPPTSPQNQKDTVDEIKEHENACRRLAEGLPSLPVQVLLLDFDGVFFESRNEEYLQKASEFTKILTPKSLIDQGAADSVINILHGSMFRIVFEILVASNIKCEIGSQRCIMEPTNSNLKSAYHALDKLFGEDRSFLQRQTAEQAYHKLRKNEEIASITNQSKLSMIDAMVTKHKMEGRDNILLVDDRDKYADGLNANRFIHVKRKNKQYNFENDYCFLFEILIRSLDLNEILQKINQLNFINLTSSRGINQVNEQHLNCFKRQFLRYIARNIYHVMKVQNEERQIAYRRLNYNSRKETKNGSKELLLNIKRLMVETPWTLGFCGGKTILLRGKKSEFIRLPHNVYYMYQQILAAENASKYNVDEKLWDKTLNNIIQQSQQALRTQGFRRSKQTTYFYENMASNIDERANERSLPYSKN